jgi:hypothetical protein
MKWRDRVSSLTTKARFARPASPEEIAELESALGVFLPGELRILLEETNGIAGEYGLGLVWPASRILEDNLLFRRSADYRELYMPFDCLLFIGDAGNGDQFAYSILDGAIRRDDIFAWDHENDSRKWVAPNLQSYVESWLSGRLAL